MIGFGIVSLCVERCTFFGWVVLFSSFLSVSLPMYSLLNVLIMHTQIHICMYACVYACLYVYMHVGFFPDNRPHPSCPTRSALLPGPRAEGAEGGLPSGEGPERSLPRASPFR